VTYDQPLYFPAADAPKLHHAQALSASSAHEDVSAVEDVQRAGAAKAKVVTVEFDEPQPPTVAPVAQGGTPGQGPPLPRAAAELRADHVSLASPSSAAASPAASTPGGTRRASMFGYALNSSVVVSPLLRPALLVLNVARTALLCVSTVRYDEASEALYRQYKKQHLTSARMATIPILANLAPQDTTAIASLFRLQTCDIGTVLYNIGDVSTDVYIVCKGVLGLMEVDASGEDHCVALVQVGTPSSYVQLRHARPHIRTRIVRHWH
jgi:hypothetical protein